VRIQCGCNGWSHQGALSGSQSQRPYQRWQHIFVAFAHHPCWQHHLDVHSQHAEFSVLAHFLPQVVESTNRRSTHKLTTSVTFCPLGTCSAEIHTSSQFSNPQ